jgi:hypothetical protein
VLFGGSSNIGPHTRARPATSTPAAEHCYIAANLALGFNSFECLALLHFRHVALLLVATKLAAYGQLIVDHLGVSLLTGSLQGWQQAPRADVFDGKIR